MRFKGLLVVLFGVALAASSLAQTKVSGQIQCGKPDDVHKIDVGDWPMHSMTVSKVACTWTKPIDIGGAQTKDGVSVAAAERSGNKAYERGSHFSNMSSGDKIYVRYQGDTVLKDEVPQSITGTFTFAGGTGKMKTLKGKGTFKAAGPPNAEGAILFDIEGEYELPAQ